MIKIGDFSKLSRVTVKALRYYDDLGLLHPVYIDTFTGYRFYTAEQLPRLNRILAYKDLGFSLDEIGRLLDENLPSEQMRGMLRLKQAELAQRVREDQDRLERVEARLIQIEQENSMPAYDVVLKHVEPMQAAMIKGVIPNYDECGPVFDRMFDDLYEYIHQQGAKAGCGFAMYFGEGDKDVDVAAVAPLESALKPGERVVVEVLPAGQMASVVHHGPFATIGMAYRALTEWVERNRYSISGPCRELYVQYERGADQSQYVTEVQFPVIKN